MANTYSWLVTALDTIPQSGSLLDVVSVVHADRYATDGTHTARWYGTMACSPASETDFTAYADLTQAQIEGWLETGLDVEAINANLDSQIENIINPPIINLPLPWASTGSIE